MAARAIGAGRMSGRWWFPCRIQTIVAGYARCSYRWGLKGKFPQYGVAKNATHVETGGVVAEVTGYRTVYVDMRVWCTLHTSNGNHRSIRVIGRSVLMATRLSAGPRHHDFWIIVIRERRAEGGRGMTGITLHGDIGMARWIRIRVGTFSDCSVMARGTRFSYRRVIVRNAIRIKRQVDELGGVVTIATLLRRLHVKLRFTNGGGTVVTIATYAVDFTVIHKGADIESGRGMAGLAIIAAGNVCAWLGQQIGKGPGMACCTVIGEATMVVISRAARDGGIVQCDYQGHGPCARHSTRANNQLHRIGAGLIGHESGIGRGSTR